MGGRNKICLLQQSLSPGECQAPDPWKVWRSLQLCFSLKWWWVQTLPYQLPTRKTLLISVCISTSFKFWVYNSCTVSQTSTLVKIGTMACFSSRSYKNAIIWSLEMTLMPPVFCWQKECEVNCLSMYGPPLPISEPKIHTSFAMNLEGLNTVWQWWMSMQQIVTN